MTTTQVQRIRNILESMPPADWNGQKNNMASIKYHNMSSNLGNGFNQGTTRQDTNSKELMKKEQLDTIDALTRHYKTQAEQEEAEFKLEEERRRKEFLEKQRQRRANYHAKLSDLEKDQVDALKLFNLQVNYSLDDLKQAYKKMAMRTHPDKPSGNAEQFQLVTKCYLSLLEKYKAREHDKQFDDLKKGSKNYLEDQKNNRMVNKEIPSGGYVDKEKFDLKVFNKIYEQNKLWDSNDDGYGDWFTSEKNEEPPTELFGNKFNLNVFNSTFEDYKERLSGQNGAIQEYSEPRELVSSATSFTDIDIYARKVDDFSKPLPIAPSGKSAKELAYTDLKTAYTSKGAFIDPNKVEYKTYKSIDELKRDRSKVRYDMSAEELKIYEMKKYKEQEEEEHRQHLIRQRDNIVANTYSKIHQKMLGYRGTAPS
jgi:curved DNA-binding protein CbpA